MAKYYTEYSFERGDDEIELFVEFSVSRYYPATYWEPAEGGDIEIDSITISGSESNTPFSLTEEEDKKLMDWLYEQTWEPNYDD